MDLVYLIFGILILLFSGDMLVRAAVDISLKMAISPMIVGLTVIAFGTSAPELLVGLQATWNGYGGLALGNIIGSNITNTLVILGMPALIIAIKSTDIGLIRNYYFMLAATFLFIVFLFFDAVTFWKGTLLLLLLILFILQAIVFNEKSSQNFNASDLEQDRKLMGVFRLVGFLSMGFVGLPVGAHIVISSATRFATSIGVSNEIIGLTVVAIGTSLPELATSMAAAYRREVNLLLGNVIGSNMFNILGIAGAAALISPLRLTDKIEFMPLAALFLSSLMLAPFILLRKPISRSVGMMFLSVYILYTVSLF